MDIVERLRAWEDSFFPPTIEDVLIAADEIEKLRKAVIEIVYRMGQGDTLGAMEIAAPIAEAALRETE